MTHRIGSRASWLGAAAIPFLLATSVDDTGAQAFSPLEPGSRLRVKVERDGDWILGEMLATDPDSVRLTLSERPSGLPGRAERVTVGTVADSRFVVPMSAIDRLQVAQGKANYVTKGAKIGAIAGAGFGTVVMIIIASDDFFSSDVGASIAFVGISTMTGVGAGALIGSFYKHDRWVEVPGPWSSGELRLRPDQLGAEVAWKF